MTAVPTLNRKVLLHEILSKLSPSELLEKIAMIDTKQNAIVISPERCLKHGISNVQVSQDNFGSRTIFQVRLDYGIKRVKNGENHI